jgi:ketosteroid isomerase-like protein
MRRRIGGAGLMLLALCLWACVARADDKAVRKELDAAYTRMARATQKKDIAAMTRYMAPDYQEVGLTGKLSNRQQAQADQKQMLTVAETLSVQFKISQATIKGSEAVVLLRYIFSMVTKAYVDPEGKTHKVVANAPMRHTWTKTKQGWLLKRVEELKGGTLTMDGKPQNIQRSR